MPFALNETQMLALASLRSQAASNAIEYWQIYKWLAEEMMSNGVARSDPTVLWLRGAAEAPREQLRITKLHAHRVNPQCGLTPRSS